MKVIHEKIRGKEFRLAIATTEKERRKGLSNTTNLKKDAGMLFIFDKPEKVTMNTHKMNYSLDMVFLDADWRVLEYSRMHEGKDISVNKDVKYVIEVNAGALTALPEGFDIEPSEDLSTYVRDVEDTREPHSNLYDLKESEEEHKNSESNEKAELSEEETEVEEEDKNIIVKFTDSEVGQLEVFKRGGRIQPEERDILMNKNAMQVLDDEGIILMNILGGERIFSREHTEELVKLARDVRKGKREAKELGGVLKKILHKQDTQDPQYVYE